MLIKALTSEVIDDYEEDICDFWDSVGYYMDPIPLPPTTTPATTAKTESTVGNIDPTTSRASSCNSYLLLVTAFSLLKLTKNLHA